MRKRPGAVTTVRGVVGGAVLALALAGCGDGAREVEPLPLEAYWAGLSIPTGLDTAFTRLLEQQELVARCMAEQGFEYVPVDYSTGAVVFDSVDLEFPHGSREFAERYGYGLTTDPYGKADEPAPELVDPNAELVASMSAVERAAYDTALHGDRSRFLGWTEEDWAAYEWDWRDDGCSGWAQHEQDRSSGVDEFAALFTELGALEEAIATDPRSTAALDAWTACMAEAGYPGLNTFDDARFLLTSEVDAAWNAALPLEHLTTTERRARDPEFDRRLMELAGEEIALATTEWDCRDATGYDAVAHEVRLEHEREFFDTHRAELDAYAEYVG